MVRHTVWVAVWETSSSPSLLHDSEVVFQNTQENVPLPEWVKVMRIPLLLLRFDSVIFDRTRLTTLLPTVDALSVFDVNGDCL